MRRMGRLTVGEITLAWLRGLWFVCSRGANNVALSEKGDTRPGFILTKPPGITQSCLNHNAGGS